MQRGALIPIAYDAQAGENWVSSVAVTICSFLHLLWRILVNISRVAAKNIMASFQLMLVSVLAGVLAV